MQTPNEAARNVHPVGRLSRRTLLTFVGTGAIALSAMAIPAGTALAQAPAAWDKTFARSERVDHQKVSSTNRLGIRIVADVYIPRNLDRSRRHPAIVVGGPYGAVKEQSAGLYAQTMAERGFIAIAHDPSYVGESGGQPHNTTSMDALVEDFSAAVDYLGSLPFVDRARIGVLGVCGSGGFGLAAAEIDPRIKAVATVSMYDNGHPHVRAFRPRWTVPRFEIPWSALQMRGGLQSMARRRMWRRERLKD